MDERKPRILYAQITKSDQGILSAEGESGRDGPLAVSPGKIGHGKPDPGGISYGTYQFTSQYIDRQGVVHEGGTAKAFLESKEGKPFRAHFKDEHGHDLKPGTAEFSKAWKSVPDVEAFAQAQHTYAGTHFYNPQADRLAAHGIDPDKRSDTLQNAVWSAAIQHGPNSSCIMDGIENKAHELGKPVGKLTDSECLSGIYAERARVHPDTAPRYAREEKHAQELLKLEMDQKAEAPTQAAAAHGLAAVPLGLSTQMVEQAAAGLPVVNTLTSGVTQELAPRQGDLSQSQQGQGRPSQTGPQQGANAGEQGDGSDLQDPHRRKKHPGGSVADYNPTVTPRM